MLPAGEPVALVDDACESTEQLTHHIHGPELRRVSAFARSGSIVWATSNGILQPQARRFSLWRCYYSPGDDRVRQLHRSEANGCVP